MNPFDRKKHWETIYQTKKLEEVSWYQPTPDTSLQLIEKHCNSTNASIIDIGGGDSFLVDNLLELGYSNITVLDISEAAINRAKERLGEKATEVKWIVADASKFTTTQKYDLWHDRAAFHFLTDSAEIDNYIETAHSSLNIRGTLVIGTFFEDGPTKCSGIEIKQYSEKTMVDRLSEYFNKKECFTTEHKTPSGSIQNFVFCSFNKK
jgi:ubiquinone/menaquinone biosynthesis C-methylase UbiE